MERIGVVGRNWRDAGPEGLASPRWTGEERARRLRALAHELDATELVFLATCNRVEVAFVGSEGTSFQTARGAIYQQLFGQPGAPGEAQRALRAWRGEGAVEHLFLVAAGLDSARLGETEIAGQVREALMESQAAGLAGPRLALLFQEALKLGRRAREDTALGTGRTSLAEIGLDAVRERLAQAPGAVALIGVSPMTERCARELSVSGVTLHLVNRTPERAHTLAASLSGPATVWSLGEFRAAPPALAALISATGAAGPVLASRELARLAAASGGHTPLLVDFATDPDLEPEGAASLGLRRLGMDEILATAEASRAGRLGELGEARSLVDEAVESFGQRLAERAVEGALGALHESYLATARDQVERLMRSHLPDLEDPQRETLRRFVDRLTRHFAHVPASGLRAVAREFGVEAVETFFARAEPKLREEVAGDLADGGHFERAGAQTPAGEAR